MSLFNRAVILFVLWPAVAFPCDQCGCSAPLSALGTLPRVRNAFVGLRYDFSSFTIRERTILNESGEVVTTDSYHRVELWARAWVHRRVQLMGTMPFRHIERIHDGQPSSVGGAGDMTLSANWTAIDHSAKFRHLLFVGGGMVLPTGSYQLNRNAKMALPGLQPGTGAFGFTVQGAYTFRYKKVGTSLDLQGRVNLVNPLGYQQGHRADASVRVFYWLEKGKVSALPTLAFTYGHGATDRMNESVLTGSGGYQMAIMPGFEVYVGNFSLGAFYRQPLAHGMGRGNITPSGAITASVIYLFN